MNIHLIRHGETIENTQHILQGTLPGTLNDNGKEQIAQSAILLKKYNIDRILCSDLKRCTDSAEIIRKELSSIPFSTTPLLRERDWGSLTGISIDTDKKFIVPNDAESVKDMKKRARLFFEYCKTFEEQNILAISHGLFIRCLRSVASDIDMAELPRMKNAEIVTITI